MPTGMMTSEALRVPSLGMPLFHLKAGQRNAFCQTSLSIELSSKTREFGRQSEY